MSEDRRTDRQVQSQSIHLLLEQRRHERRSQPSPSVVSAAELLSNLSMSSPQRKTIGSPSSHASFRNRPDLDELLKRESYHWRRDPLESLSDWILEVRVLEELALSDDGYADDLSLATCSDDDYSLFPIELYHIHKAVMVHHADRDRRSRFFERLFASSSKSTCEIALSPTAASAIPIVLDWMYGQPLAITTQSATALYHLGGYLQIPELQKRALDFCKKDVKLKNAHVYYKHAKRLDEPEIIQLTAQLVGSKIRSIDWKVPLVDECRAPFWKYALPFCTCPRRASLFVAIACARDHCEMQLDPHVFRQLTRQKWMPDIDSRVACTYLRIEADFAKPKLATTSMAPETQHGELTCLQRRCLASLARDWHNVTPETLRFLTKNIPAKVLDVLMKQLDLVSDGLSVTLDKDNQSGQSVMSSIDDMNLMLLGEGKYAV